MGHNSHERNTEKCHPPGLGRWFLFTRIGRIVNVKNLALCSLDFLSKTSNLTDRPLNIWLSCSILPRKPYQFCRIPFLPLSLRLTSWLPLCDRPLNPLFKHSPGQRLSCLESNNQQLRRPAGKLRGDQLILKWLLCGRGFSPMDFLIFWSESHCLILPFLKWCSVGC